MAMKISEKGLNLIKEFEGLKLSPYLCSANVPTIGYGSTRYEDGSRVKLTDKAITKERAETLLMYTMQEFERIVLSKVRVTLTQNQFDALVSHTYNTGGSDGLFKLVNNKASEALIRDWFENRYITAAGVVQRGLIRRRKAEAEMFFQG
jgi:lysozyme